MSHECLRPMSSRDGDQAHLLLLRPFHDELLTSSTIDYSQVARVRQNSGNFGVIVGRCGRTVRDSEGGQNRPSSSDTSIGTSSTLEMPISASSISANTFADSSASLWSSPSSFSANKRRIMWRAVTPYPWQPP